MISLVRNGSRSIYITTKKIELLINFLKSHFNAQEIDIKVIQDRSREYQTVLFISDELLSQDEKEESIRSFLILEEPVIVLSELITNNVCNMIDTIQPGANFIIMRATGDLEKIIYAIQRDLGGEIISYDQYIKNDNSDYTIIGLTEKPISKGIVFSDFNENFLMIRGEYGKIKREIRMQALRYLNIGIDNQDWNEIEIRIYDQYGAYNLHYDRLMEVFDDLDIGLVLGESWSKDYPKALLAVQVYSVRFFTFKNPNDLKRILFGLEYLADGTRIVDYDLYYKKDKLPWNKNLKRRKKEDRYKEALIARNEILDKLSDSTVKAVKELEKDIINSRY